MFHVKHSEAQLGGANALAATKPHDEQGVTMAKDIPYDQKYYDPEIECMPRPELEALQLERLKDMVAYAYDNTEIGRAHV